MARVINLHGKPRKAVCRNESSNWTSAKERDDVECEPCAPHDDCSSVVVRGNASRSFPGLSNLAISQRSWADWPTARRHCGRPARSTATGGASAGASMTTSKIGMRDLRQSTVADASSEQMIRLL